MDKQTIAYTGNKMRKESESERQRGVNHRRLVELKRGWVEESRFFDLIEKNKDIVNRAIVLNDLGGEAYRHGSTYSDCTRYDREGPVIAIGEVEGNLCVASVFVSKFQKDNYGITDEDSFEAKFSFKIVDQSTYEQVQQNPLHREALRGSDMPDEQTYKMSEYKIDRNDLFWKAYKRAPTGSINPVRGLGRVITYTKVSHRLNKLESTVILLEEAARSPELNPLLAQTFPGVAQK